MNNAEKKHITPTWLILGILLIAMNLRAPITDIAPILDIITQKLHLSMTQAGMLTTLPLLAFAICSPLSSKIAQRMGLEPSLMLALLIIIGGLILRSVGVASCLFVGTFILGVGIAIANVLLPSVLKRDFPTKITTLTAIYVLVMGVGSALSSALVIPAFHLGKHLPLNAFPTWAFALISILILPIIATVIWIPQLKNRQKPISNTALAHHNHRYIWRSPIAWAVSGFLGINSFLMYIFISWLPSILIADGYSDQTAGMIQGLLQFSTAVPALILIPLMAKIHDKRLMTFSLAIITFLSLLGFLFLPQYAAIWTFMFGFSAGGGFILGLSFMALRTSTPYQAAALSGMSQCFGYLLAATGPILMGSLHQLTGHWTVPLIFCAVISIIWGVFALIAGKDGIIPHPAE